MQLRAIALLMGCCWSMCLTSDDAAAQYRPGGRQRRAPSAVTRHAPSSRTAPGVGTPSSSTTPAPDASSVIRSPSASEAATLERLFASALQHPTNHGLIDRIGELGRLDPDAQKRGLEGLVELSRSAAPRAKNALLVLHALYEQLGQFREAEGVVELMLARYREDASILEYLGNRALLRGQSALGRDRLLAAVRHTTVAAEKLRLLRRVRNSHLDSGDIAAATELQERLLALGNRDPKLTIEFGRELLARAEHRAGIDVLSPVLQSVALEPKLKTQMLRDIAAAALLAGDVPTARQYAERAWLQERQEPSVSFKRLLTDVYRSSDGLEALVGQLERSPSLVPARLVWLAELHEELGQLKRAIAFRRQMLAIQPRDREGRLALVRALEAAGDVEGARREREVLVRTCPECVDQALVLAVEFHRQGQSARAVAVLDRLERGQKINDDAAVRLADVWEHLGQSDRAERALARASKGTTNGQFEASGAQAPPSSANAPATHGSHGDEAVATWLQRAEAALHQSRIDEAIPWLDRVRQTKRVTASSMARVAMAFERAAASATKDALAFREQAERIWIELLTTAQLFESELTDAITRVVRIWVLRGTLAEQTSRLEARFEQHPSERGLGIWLAEAQERLGLHERAARTLARLSERWPNDLTLLDRIAVLARQRGDLEEAMAAAERQLNQRSRVDADSLRRLVDLAVQAKQDARAVGYAKRWVEVASTDADAWQLYARSLRRIDTSPKGEARKALLRALQLRPERADFALELADWLTQDGEPEAAFARLSFVLRTATEERLVVEAARRSIPLAAALKRIESLELALRQASLRLTPSSVLRNLLLELDAHLIQNSARDRRSPDTSTRAAAEALLDRVGPRANATLIASLSDRSESRQQLALELLEEITPRGVGPELLTFANGASSVELRRRAMLLLSRLADPAMLPRLDGFLRSRANPTQASPVALAAAYAVSRIASPEATNVLRKLLGSSSQELRGFVALWLAERNDHSGIVPLLSLRSNSAASPSTRAAATCALTRLASDSPSADGAVALPASRIERLMLLAQLAASGKNTDWSMVAEILTTDIGVQPDVVTAIATRFVGAPCASFSDVLNRPESLDDLAHTLLRLSECRASNTDRVELFLRVAGPLGQRLLERVESGTEGARAAGRLLLERGEELGFGRLAPDQSGLTETDKARLARSVETHFHPVATAFGSLLEHSDPELRRLAIGVRVLLLKDEDALVRGLLDESPSVRSKSLTWSKYLPTDAVLSQIANRLRRDPAYVIRRAAAEVLGALVHPPANGELLEALRHAARNDAFSSVRAAALSSLVRTNPLAATVELSYAESHDSEPEVVGLARQLREKKP